MKKIFLTFSFILLAIPSLAKDRTSLDIAKNVVKGGQIVDIKENAISVVNVIIINNPRFENKRNDLESAFEEVLKSDKMITQMAEIYTIYFTKSELLELEKLMRNPVMVKWLKNMPLIMPELVKVNNNFLQRTIAETLKN